MEQRRPRRRARGTYMITGQAHSNNQSVEQLEAALSAYDETIAILLNLIRQEGRVELSNDLATAIMNKGNALQALGQLDGALGCAAEAITILRRMVERDGRAELRNDLAIALYNRALAHGRRRQLAEARRDAQEARDLWHSLAEGQAAFRKDEQDAQGLLDRLALL